MNRFLSVFLLLCSACQSVAQLPIEGLAYSIEPTLQDITPIRGMTSEQFSKLSIGDPLLRLGYADLIASELMLQIYTRNTNIHYSTYPSWQVAALEDLRRRGDAATPVLLDIAAKNPNSGLETGVLSNAPCVVNDPSPYLEYARKVIKNRTMEMDSSVAGAVAELLVSRGTAEDLERLRSLIKVRPYLTATIENQLRYAAIFKAAKDETSVLKTVITPPGEAALEAKPVETTEQAPETKPVLKAPIQEPATLISWGIIALPVTAALGLIWLLLRKRA